MPEISQDRFSCLKLNRELLNATLLRSLNGKGLAGPIEIIESQTPNLFAPERIHGSQEQDRVQS